MLDPETGKRFWNEILGVGGSRPPSVRDQGGEYLSIGTMTGQFRDVADGVIRRLQAGPGLGGH